MRQLSAGLPAVVNILPAITIVTDGALNVVIAENVRGAQFPLLYSLSPLLLRSPATSLA
jgi:hypothetical protein